MTGVRRKKTTQEDNRNAVFIRAEEVEVSADVALPRPLVAIKDFVGHKDPELKAGGHLSR